MDVKLTLKMDEKVIRSAKEFAKSHHTSLSKLTENYLKTVTNSTEYKKESIPGVVGELAGLLKNKEIDYSRDSYTDYLDEKYS